MTRPRFIQLAAATAAAGGAAWIAKFAVLVPTDGRDSLLASAFFVLGVALMALGASWVPARLAGDRALGVLALAALLGPLLFFVSFVVLEAPAKAVVGETGPDWLNDETGILVTGLFWLAVSLPRASDSLASVPWRPRKPSTTR